MIIDTDVLIWYMRGNTKAYRVIHRQRHGFSLSVVTYIELVQGMRNKRELNEFKKALRSLIATCRCAGCWDSGYSQPSNIDRKRQTLSDDSCHTNPEI